MVVGFTTTYAISAYDHNRTGFGEFKLNYLTQFEIFSFEVVLMNETSMLISVDSIA
jgi:hypothetical protein